MREPGRTTPVRAVNGIASSAANGLLGLSSEGRRPVGNPLGSYMLDPQKKLERETMLKRIRELDAEIAQLERNMREGEASLPIEAQAEA